MAEEKGKEMAEEKANKLDIILDEMRTKFKSVFGRFSDLEGKIEGAKVELNQKMDSVHTSLKQEINTTAKMLD